MFCQKITFCFVFGIIVSSCSNNTLDQDRTTLIIEEAKEAGSSKEEKNESTKEINSKSTELIPSPHLSGRYTVTPFLNDTLGWGYSILEGDKMIVNQPHIPAVSGLKGFASKEKAKRAGEEVAFKLEQGIMPPSLTIEEMKALHVLE